MRKLAAIHELSAGVWLVESPIGLNPGDAGGVLCKSPHSLVCAMLRAAGVDPATYLASFGALPTPEPKPEPPPNCDFPITPTVLAEEVPADDDEGSAAEPARYPPGTACNITGECE